jgi:hypothetical protein
MKKKRIIIDEGSLQRMRNFQLYVAAIVLGVIALIVGVLYVSGAVLGYHPTRGYVGLGAGVILLIIGIAGMVVRPRE